MAIWEKLFSKIIFKDYPDTSTPLNASNMNALSDAIDGIDNRVVELNSKLVSGYYTEDKVSAVITDFLEPTKDSILGRASFVRGISGLKEIPLRLSVLMSKVASSSAVKYSPLPKTETI